MRSRSMIAMRPLLVGSRLVVSRRTREEVASHSSLLLLLAGETKEDAGRYLLSLLCLMRVAQSRQATRTARPGLMAAGMAAGSLVSFHELGEGQARDEG